MLLLYWDLALRSMAELHPTFQRDVVVAGRPCGAQHQQRQQHTQNQQQQQHSQNQQHQQHQHQHQQQQQHSQNQQQHPEDRRQQQQQQQQQGQETRGAATGEADKGEKEGGRSKEVGLPHVPCSAGPVAMDLGGLVSAIRIRGSDTHLFLQVREWMCGLFSYLSVHLLVSLRFNLSSFRLSVVCQPVYPPCSSVM